MKKYITIIKSSLCLIRRSPLAQAAQLNIMLVYRTYYCLKVEGYELWSFSGGIELLGDIA